MKLDRLLGITIALMSRRRVTATELAARFEVSVRTIYRDVELINQAGVPVASFAGADGGFELMDGFFLSKQHFSIDDFSVLYQLLKGLEQATGGGAAALMQKLASVQPALLNGRDEEKIVFHMGASDSEKAVIPMLLKSVRERRVIGFSYTDASGRSTERQAEPVQLYWERGVWYVEAYCLARRARRWFRVSRMSRLEVAERTFIPRDPSEQAPQEPQEREEQGISARLRFDLSVQARVLDQFPGQCRRLEDGIEVDTLFYKRAYAVSVVLSYGSQVVIVSPNNLKDDLMAEMERIRQRYAGTTGDEGASL